MKTLLTLALIGISFLSWGQANEACKIYYISKDTVHIGDSAWVQFISADSWPQDTTDMNIISLDASGTIKQVFKDTYYHTQYTLKKVYDPTTHDSMMRVHFVIPTGIPYGPAQYIARSNTKFVYIKCDTCHTVIDTTHAGIVELALPDTPGIWQYFDMMGREQTQLLSGQMYIRQSKRKREIILVQ